MPRSSYVIAALLAAGVVVWMASGFLLEPATHADRAAREPRQPVATLVEVTASSATPVTRYLFLQGDARAFRRVAVRAETAGRIAEILAREGQVVERGQRLFELTLEARASQQREAEANIAQARKALDGALELAEKGYTPKQRVDQLRAELAAAEAALARIREEIADTTVEAPFSGVLNNIAVEPGQFVTVGGELATLLDNEPLRVAVQVAQQDIARIDRGIPATVTFATGRTANGRVCFISSAADPQTRTFLVEVRVANARQETPSGTSAEVRLATGTTPAHFVSPSILSLDQDGVLGIKSIDDGNTVVFHPIDVVRAETGGVWVRGLPAQARLITTGQGFVRAGDTVRLAEAEPSAENRASPALPTATTRQAVGRKQLEAPTGSPPADLCDGVPTTSDGTQSSRTAGQGPGTGSPP